MGLGRTLTQDGKLILTLFMKKVNEKTNLVPQEFMKQMKNEVEDEYSNEDIWEMSQSGVIILCMGFILKLLICLCCFHKKLKRTTDLALKSNLNNKNESALFLERDNVPDLDMGVIV